MSLIQLLALKEEETQKAYVAYMNANAQLNFSHTRHAQLSGYKLDYMHQMERLGNEGGTIGQLRNRIEFINNLDGAISQLNIQLAQLEKQSHYFELLYNKAQSAENAVKKLIERKQAVEDLKIQRAEQKDSDEYAQKQWYTNQSIAKKKTPIEYSD